MKALIIEDEHIAAKALESLITEISPETEILAVLQSIEESVEWFSLNVMPDLIFLDIHLADGTSFSIFDEVEISCPVIFTTAYDEYALKAFEVNSVDYLLKPINKADLERAINKYKNLHSADNGLNGQEVIARLIGEIRKGSVNFKSSLLVSHKDKLIPVPVKELAYICIDSKVVEAHTFSGKKHVLSQTLEELSEDLDPNEFFRANRQNIISRKAVKDISYWFGSKLAVNLNVPTKERIYISKSRVKEFKEWITG